MVISCVAFGCKSKQKSGDRSISFYRFPHTRPELLAKWVLSIRREKWQPSLYSRLCSNHFTESCYKIRPGAEVKLLRDDAIPTIFSFTDHLNTKASAQRALMGKKLNNTTINDSRTRNDSVESLSLEGNLSSNQPGGKVVHSILADHPYCSNILHEKNENLREQIKQGTLGKKNIFLTFEKFTGSIVLGCDKQLHFGKTFFLT